MDTFLFVAAFLITFSTVNSHGVRHRIVANRERLGPRYVTDNNNFYIRQSSPAAWTEWNIIEVCSVTCGIGLTESKRNCTTGDIRDCSSLPGTWWSVAKCDAGPCTHVPAAWTEWGVQTQCSESCGKSGFLEEIRNCTTGRIADCEKLGGRYWKVRTCDSGPCTAYWTEWGDPSPCSKTCGTGVHVRYRACSTGNTNDCKSVSTENVYELTACKGPPCVDGVTTPVPTTVPTTTVKGPPATWSEWSNAVQCSVTCGDGFGERLRNCSTGHDSDCVGRHWLVTTCNLRECIINGVWGAWTAWSSCSATCDNGIANRTRSCTYPDPNNKGAPCSGDSSQQQTCNDGKCPVDGTWGDWSSWSTCSQTCDEGQITRTRVCNFPNDSPRGADCVGSGTESMACTEEVCKSDGSWAPWSSWSQCSSTCGQGIKFKARICVFDNNRPAGKDCSGESIDRSSCSKQLCEVDGSWMNWSFWSQCTATCGGGYRSRNRVCAFDPVAPHGADCVGDSKEIDSCAQKLCPVDGLWGGWSTWAACTVSCGGGTQSKTRICNYIGAANAPHGKSCDGDGVQTKDCNTKLCAVDGHWSEWSSFGPCNATCGGGFKIKARLCQYDKKAPHGRQCEGSDKFVEQCNPQLCPVDGQLTSWQDWTFCSASCDGGTRSRKRECYFPLNVPHGADCNGNLSEIGQCNESPCPTTTTTTTEAPVPGHWSDWSSWSVCTLTCESGTHTRNRTCLYPDASLHGEKCQGDSNQTDSCNTQHCPVDGSWSNWSVYSKCSTSCGNGTHSRTRTCDFDPRYDQGQNCTGSSVQNGNCWAGYCPVDGVWKDWTSWQSCSVTCGGGTQERSRTCFHPVDRPIGENCTGPDTESQSCGTNFCPVDGTLSLWTSWTACPVTCGGDIQIRNRTCDFPSDRPHGKDCLGDLDQTQTCNSELCPIDGVWSDWVGWSTCSKTCGTGSHSRTRTCIFDKDAPHGALCAGAGEETQQCNTDLCPIDGHWTEWVQWTQCSVSCENGTRSRDRICAFDDTAPRGNNCTGDSSQMEGCNDGPCPVDGIWSNWAVWSVCTASCGNGSKTRDRTCDFPPPPVPHGNNCTGPSQDMDVCNTQLCPVDGHFDSWSIWSTCSVTCGGGNQARQRKCLFDPLAPHGLDCPGDFNETQSCNTNLCPVDGVWSEWSNYTACSSTCGGGSRVRQRKCDFRPEIAPHGLNCTGPGSQTESCSTNLCPVDGVLSEWSQWSVCSVTCAGGTRSRNRTCDFDAVAPHGDDCVGDLTATEACNTERCPVNGHWSEWSGYTTCTVTCAGGTQTRNRTCIFDADAPHGAACYGNTTYTQDCNTQPCPVDGIWSSWNAWHSCDVTCGGGNRARDRDCFFPPDTPHGNNCTTGTAHDVEPCNDNLCPVDGTWSDWTAWTKCSKTCGGGVKFHTRKCQFPKSVPHGDNCTGDESDKDTCGDSLCPVDGVWSNWETWSTCTVTCGGGERSRNRNCTYNINPDNPEPTGDPCLGNNTDTESCSTNVCPVDGSWTQWSTFTPCTKTCGNGTSTRNRTCEYLPLGSPHGNDCPGNTVDVISCNGNECPQDAVWQAWSTWTTCSVTCGGGNQTRDRVCTWPSSVHGDNCTGDSMETQDCSKNLCPIDGTWSNWSEWSDCSTSCDVGHNYRSRNCTYDPVAPKGAPCPGRTDESKFCKKATCEVDGVWSVWTAWSVCSTTCGGGNVTRTRRCDFIPSDAPHGQDCVGNSMEYQPCDNVTDCPVDGVWGTWTAWSVCSTSCGNGDKHRSRVCEFDPNKPQGDDCPGANTNETDACNLGKCPVDGHWLQWSSWASCSVTCGGGNQTRTRTCFFQPDVPHGDTCLGDSSEQQSCNTNTCEVDGVFAEWSTWSKCSVTCGNGTSSRSRTCTFDPPDAPKGKNCTGNWQEQKGCSEALCPVDGSWAQWGAWSSCTATCGGGTQGRIRDCEFPPHVPQGDFCVGAGTEQRTCGNNTCPVDGSWAQWGAWSSCTATCGGGTQGRIRDCEFPPHVPQGDFCVGAGTEQRTCSNNTCPVDGIFTDWSTWSACSVTCGNGDKTRTRTCEFNPPDAPKGQNCSGEYSQTHTCSAGQLCKVDGSWAQWGVWSTCTVTCGGGTQGRIRDCEFPPHVPQGEFCVGAGTEQRNCSDNICPVFCHVCDSTPDLCEFDYHSAECPLDKRFCINSVENFENAMRNIVRKCGTRDECKSGWYDTTSLDDKCTTFSEDFIYANNFNCEFCCEGDNCNEKVNMDNKWSP
ncbi:hypothetical protein ACF0H5_014894 [Mactra antiquata]